MKRYLPALIVLGIVVFLVYEALIYHDENFPYGRMWETPAIRPHEERPPSPARGAVPLKGGEELFRATPSEALKSPIDSSDPRQVQPGRVLYEKFCAQCHGKDHDGNAPVGQSFHPLPTDLRSAKVQSLSEGAFFKEISYGIAGGRQPPLATTIEAVARWQIIAYVKSLGTRK